MIKKIEANKIEIKRLKKITKNKDSIKDYDRILEILENTKEILSEHKSNF